MKTSIFSGVRRTSENLNVFITRDENFYGIHVSDIITYVTNQNTNVMLSTLSA